MTDQEINEAAKDALTTGEGFITDGKRIDPKDIYKSESEIINEAVARKLGWHQAIKENSEFYVNYWYSGEGSLYHKEPPDYCRSIEAAWEIVQWFTNEGHAYKIEQDFGMDDFVRVTICDAKKAGMDCCDFTDAPTAPMAICRAFLKMGDKL